MKAEKQQQQQQQPTGATAIPAAGIGSDGNSPAPNGNTAKKGQSSAAPSLFSTTNGPETGASNSEAAGEDDLGRQLELWWDEVLAFFNRHRATAALVAWAGVFLFDIMDLHMPAEWLVFTFFSFSVFVQAFGMSVVFFALLTVAMTVVNVAIFYMVPYTTTSLFSTIVVCMLLVRGVHGLDSKGWALTAVMSLARIGNPWCSILPEYLQAPIAAYCTSFGILWLAYHHARRLERLLDPACLLLGIIPPPAPRLGIVEIRDTSVIVSWAAMPKSIVTAGDSDNSPGIFGPGGAMNSIGAGDAQGVQSATLAPGDGRAEFASTVLTIGNGLISIDRKGLREARVARYEIEVNGHIVGSCSGSEDYTRICGLQSAHMYQLRIWAVSQSRGRTASQPVFVSTLSQGEAQQQQQQKANGTKTETANEANAASIKAEIEISQREVDALERSIAELREHADEERARLQREIHELKAKRKEEELAKAAQRDKIRELEAEKRRLDSEKIRLDTAITDAMGRRQRALERMRDQERKTEEYTKSARALEETMQKEKRDHGRQQEELKNTIGAIKAEVEKAQQRLDELTAQQADLAASLKAKRAELTVQEKKNAELDAQIKETVRRRHRMQDDRSRIAMSAEKIQAEISALLPQLDEATSERQRLQALANAQTMRRYQPAVSTASPLPLAASPTRVNPFGELQPPSLAYQAQTMPVRRSSQNSGFNHARSSSFANMSGGFGDAVVPTIGSAQGMSISGVGSRRSADLSDLLLFWDRSVPLATSSAAIDSLSLINAGAPLDAASDLDFVRHLSPVNSVRDTGRLTRSSLWGSSAGDPSLSTTTAEASALSILKDTDLAYPTPARQRSSGGSSIGRMSDLARRDFQRPSMASAGHARPLDRILTSSFENLDQRSVLGNATSPHFRFQSLDLRAGSGWPDFERADGRESGRSSTVNDRPSPVFPEAVAGQQSADPFSLRSTTPAAEQTQSLIFGGSLVNPRRPLVEPIGAPVRKREREQKQSSDQGVDALANPLRIPIDREMSHPTSFGGSLYHSRSIWDADDKDDRRK